MNPDEKIFKVLQTIKDKVDLAPIGSVIDYRAGREANELDSEDEILILNKLAMEGSIEVVDNFDSEYI